MNFVSIKSRLCHKHDDTGEFPKMSGLTRQVGQPSSATDGYSERARIPQARFSHSTGHKDRRDGQLLPEGFLVSQNQRSHRSIRFLTLVVNS